MDNQNQIEEAKVIKSLEPQIRFLSKKIKIKGFDSDDIAQELRILVIEELRSKRGINFGVNAWFLRLKWHAIYLYRLHSTEPLSKSITIEKLLGDTDNIDWKNYGRTGK